MTRKAIKQEIIAILGDMGIGRNAITEKANFSKDLGLDSLDFTEMVMQFENRFDIAIPSSEAETICTVKQAIDYLKNLLNKRTAIV